MSAPRTLVAQILRARQITWRAIKNPLACHKWHACQGLPTPVLEKQLEVSVGVEIFYRFETKNTPNTMTAKLNGAPNKTLKDL